MKVWVGADDGGYDYDQVAQLHKPTEEQKKLRTWRHLEVGGAMDVDELRFHLGHITVCATKDDMDGVKDELVKVGMLHRGEGEEESAAEMLSRARRTPCAGCGALPLCEVPGHSVVYGFQCSTMQPHGRGCSAAHALPVNAVTWLQRNSGVYEEVDVLEQDIPPIKDAPLPREKVQRDLQHVMELHDLNEPQRALPALVDAIENVLRITGGHDQHFSAVESMFKGQLTREEHHLLRTSKLEAWIKAASERFMQAEKVARERLWPPKRVVDQVLSLLLTGEG